MWQTGKSSNMKERCEIGGHRARLDVGVSNGAHAAGAGLQAEPNKHLNTG
jgi:hypothetical protein